MESNQPKELEYYEIPILTKYILDATKILSSDIDTLVCSGIKIDSKEKVAFKLRLKKFNDFHRLKNEYIIYKELEGIKRIPKVYTVNEQGNYNILITELLGQSLKTLMKYVGEKFSLATTLKIGVQVLDIIKEIHKKGIVLRYLKPGNMVIGEDKNKDFIYLIDFEIAKKYLINEEHIPYRNNIDVRGNRDYISINTHNGIEISRRDDIESLGYNLIYFMKGELPWRKERDSKSILEKKINTSLDELCKGLPEEFKVFIKYSRELEFEQEPDYNYLNKLLLTVAKKNGINIDKSKYDWEIKDEEMKKEKEKEELKENKINEKDKNKKEEKKLENKEKIEEDKEMKKDKLIVVFDEDFAKINIK